MRFQGLYSKLSAYQKVNSEYCWVPQGSASYVSESFSENSRYVEAALYIFLHGICELVTGSPSSPISSSKYPLD